MPNLQSVANTSLSDIAKALAARPISNFVLIYHDRDVDEWVTELSPQLDGLLVANLLNLVQGRMLELMLHQQQTQAAANAEIAATPAKASA